MLRHVLRRLVSGVLLLFALTLVTFIVYYKIPSDPGRVLCRGCPGALLLPTPLRAHDQDAPARDSRRAVRAHRAGEGASELRILRRHVLKNALLPIMTMLAMDMGTALTAAVYVETVFGLPGLGLVAVRAISGANGPFDLPVILGIVFVVAVTVVLLTLIVDLLYGFLDPRIRVGSEARA
jgi:ABC-type dipeptide/oligopeptide/nickel transport system permease component